MTINKSRDMTPYNMARKPCRQNIFLTPLIWAFCWLKTFGRLKMDRGGMKGLKPPFLVLSQHQGFYDYYITPLALFPYRANYVSDVDAFAYYGNTIYRNIGCIATRRFASGIQLIRNIRHAALSKKGIVVVYPEAKHSIIGINSPLPESVGKLIKLLNLPVIVQKLYGSYLSQPVWDEQHERKSLMRCILERVIDGDKVEEMSVSEITALVNKHFEYDEYLYQYEDKISIDYPKRAEGLDKALFLCVNCGAYKMNSRGHTLECSACGKQWEMNEYGRLNALDGETEYEHIPNWYAFQREHVKNLIECNCYSLDIEVTVEAMPNEKGFVSLGTGRLVHDTDGFTLTLEDGEELRFSTMSLPSVHIEYDYRGEKGDCVVLSKQNCCYYLYPLNGDCRVTEVMLAGELFHEKKKAALQQKRVRI